MKQHIISFLVTFSPLFIGLLGFLLYWFIVFSRRIYKAYTNYEQDRKRMDDKINIYQNSVITLSNQLTKVDIKINKIEGFIKNKQIKAKGLFTNEK